MHQEVELFLLDIGDDDTAAAGSEQGERH